MTGTYRLLVLLAATLAVYAPGINGGFIFDDYANIVNNAYLQQAAELTPQAIWQAGLSGVAGGFGRPVAMLSFWVNQHFTGPEPRAFKLTNIFIHLLAGIALYWLCLLLLRGHAMARGADAAQNAGAIALTASALWLLHPLNLTSVLYVVQRMTSLAALFTLLGLVCYAAARLRLMQGQPGFGRLITGVSGFGVLAVLSKENGVLLPLYLLAIELFLFRFVTAKTSDRRGLQIFFVALVVIPGLVAGALLLANSEWILAGYEQRSFTLMERLLTQSRVLWLYLGWTLLPLPSALGLFHDDVALSHGLLEPWTTLPALAGIFALLAAAVLARRRLPMLSFALAWFFFGHALESTIISLGMVYEHRNYAPLMGLAMAAAYGLYSLPARFPIFAVPIAAVSLVWVLSLAGLSAVRVWHWSDPTRQALQEQIHHPASAQANFTAAITLLDPHAPAVDAAAAGLVDYNRLKAMLERAVALDPSAVRGFDGLVFLSLEFRRPIEQGWLDELEHRLRTQANHPLHSLLGMVDALIQKDPHAMSRQQVVTLFGAALENPRSTNETKSLLLLVLARYFAMAAHDAQQAVTLAIAATEYDPHSAELRVSLAQLAISLGNPAYAVEQIARARALDRLGRYGHTLKLLEAQLVKPADVQT